MENIALQLVAESIGTTLPSKENILFNIIQYTSGDVSYDPVTGEITLASSGRYIAHWWVTTQSAAPHGRAILALVSDKGLQQIGNSPIKTGEMYGFGAFEVAADDLPVKLSLQNINNETIYLSSTTPVQASLLLIHDALPAYAYVYTPYRTSHWAIESGNFFVFYENGPLRNIEHDPVTSEITVLELVCYQAIVFALLVVVSQITPFHQPL